MNDIPVTNPAGDPFSSPESSPPTSEPAPVTIGKRPAKSPRRVGTLTLGVCLVVVGILALTALFNPNFNFLLVAKCSPVIFILLGIEVLIAYIKNDGDKIKYDFLSGFICLVLIFASIGATLAVPVLKYYGPERYFAEEAVTQSVYDLAYDRLLPMSDVSSLHVEVDLYGITEHYPRTYGELGPADRTSFYIRLSPTSASKLEFAEKCGAVLQVLSALPVDSHLIVHVEGPSPNDNTYSLHLSDKLAMTRSAQDLLAYVHGDFE